MDKYHYNSRIPHKNSKYHKLTKEEIKENKDLAKDRIFIEHTTSWIKRVKMLSTKFRNHLSYFAKVAVLLVIFIILTESKQSYRTNLIQILVYLEIG